MPPQPSIPPLVQALVTIALPSSRRGASSFRRPTQSIRRLALSPLTTSTSGSCYGGKESPRSSFVISIPLLHAYGLAGRGRPPLLAASFLCCSSLVEDFPDAFPTSQASSQPLSRLKSWPLSSEDWLVYRRHQQLPPANHDPGSPQPFDRFPTALI